MPKTETPKKQFLNYIHYFRGIAILFVVGGHCYLNLDWEKGRFDQKFTDTLWQNGSVLFVFIAGYLFQHLSKKFRYPTYLKAKLKNVIMPYFVVSAIPLAYRLFTNKFTEYTAALHPDIYTWPWWHKLYYMILHGAHLPQLWFVPMIAIFYIIAPLLLYIDRHPKLYYSLLGFIVVSLIVPREPFSDILKMFAHFFSVYLFGMFMSHYKNEYLAFAKKYWPLITGLTVAAFVLNIVFYDSWYDQLNYIHKMLFCCFFLYWLWRLDKYIPKFFNYLAEISFGVFFVHYYFNIIYYSLANRYLPAAKVGSFLNWTIFFLFVFAGTIALITFVRKVFPKYSKNLIGC